MQKIKGFTIIELVVALGIFATLTVIGYIRSVDIERRAPIGATVDTVIADLRSIQTKAMIGASQQSYSFSIPSYPVPANITISTTFPGSVITFTKGSGDIAGFSGGNNTLTITQTLTGEHKIITINQYGAVTSVQ
ncbi:MAG: prepilin-type N-terminal cleavage/methylation domain-containing protein [Candidatus Gottesmanbacteria bacterium]|nr:prepilin-type N-terminal cleavage/methylation domain-containing protein [Candidatus Gottesmanbacteria bacterium]